MGKPEQFTKGIETPGPNDIISGRGPANHPGNKYYRELVGVHKKEYVACSYHEKKKVSEKILDAIRNWSPPGRFLKQDNGSELWHEMTRKEALNKVRQCLRENAAAVMDEVFSESCDNKTDNMKTQDANINVDKAESMKTQDNFSKNICMNESEGVILVDKNKDPAHKEYPESLTNENEFSNDASLCSQSFQSVTSSLFSDTISKSSIERSMAISTDSSTPCNSSFSFPKDKDKSENDTQSTSINSKDLSDTLNKNVLNSLQSKEVEQSSKKANLSGAPSKHSLSTNNIFSSDKASFSYPDYNQKHSSNDIYPDLDKDKSDNNTHFPSVNSQDLSGIASVDDCDVSIGALKQNVLDSLKSKEEKQSNKNVNMSGALTAETDQMEKFPHSSGLSISSDAIISNFSTNQSTGTVSTGLFSEDSSKAATMISHSSAASSNCNSKTSIFSRNSLSHPDFDKGESDNQSFSVHSKDLSGICSLDEPSSTSKENMLQLLQSENSGLTTLRKKVNPSDALATDSDQIEKLLSSSMQDKPLLPISSKECSQDDSDYKKELPNYFDNLENNITLASESSEFTTYCISSPSFKHALKVMKEEASELTAIQKLNNEYKTGNEISHPGIRKPIKKGSFLNKPSLVLEWVEGTSIQKCNKFSVKDFLVISSEILHALEAMHGNKVIHRNLTAEHIIVNLNSSSAKIIGFSSSSNFYDKSEKLEGDFRYISPEQIGPQNQNTDFRSDFYNLGIVFHFMLTGKLPFQSDNLSELKRMHMFQEVQPLHIIDPSIPVPISNLVAKLMKKRPEERYQSAKGILYDLELMASEYATDSQLGSITLAENDFSEKILFSQRLYGRREEYKTLISAVDRVCSGSFETVFIAGISGSGKSSLVLEMCEYIAKKKGFFATGKYEKTRKDEPFSGLIEAFESFCSLVLMEDEACISQYRKLIQDAVGDEGKVLTDLISNLSLIIGDQPNIPAAVGKSAKNRLYYIFMKFARAITQKNPLLFFFDDLQWADSDSLQLLLELMMDKSIKHLLIVGAYRDDEVNNSHPLTKVLKELENENVKTNHVKLGNLSVEDVNSLIAEALRRRRVDTYHLTALVIKKTRGNPLFVMQFLMFLSDKKILYFCYAEHQWKWDWEKFDIKNINDSVSSLIKENILKLDSATQNVLKIASCLGNTFSVSTIKLLTDEFEALKQAVSEGMLTAGKDSLYRFAHDQIWQAAYSLIPDDEKNTTRHNIGKQLWEKCSNEKLEDFIFIIANLLSSAPDIVSDPEERTQMAKLFLKAGEKSKLSTAFKSASIYLATGINLLKSGDWKEEYELSLKLYRAASEAAYCQMNYSLMNDMIENVLKNAATVMDKVPCYSLIIRAFNDRRKYDEAISSGLEALGELGQSFPKNIDGSLVLNVMKEASALLMKLTDCDSFDEMTNATALASMQILSDFMSACYYARPTTLLPLVAIRVVHLTLEHGISVHSAAGFSLLAAILSRRPQNVKYGNHIGNLALLLLEKFPSKETTVTVSVIVLPLVKWRHDHLSSIIKPLLNTYKIALETGNHEKTEIIVNTYCYITFFGGQSMTSLENGIATFMEARFLDKTIPIAIQKMISIFVFSETRDPVNLIKDMTEDSTRYNDNTGKSSGIYILCLMAATFFRAYDVAMKLIQVKESSFKQPGSYLAVFHDFAFGLVSLSLAKNSAEKSKLISDANECIERLKIWSSSCPDNFLNKLALLQAELSAVNGDESLAMQFYDQSRSLAKKNNFFHEEALACEKAAVYLFERKKNHNARRLLFRAYEAYFQWGATAKLIHLRKLYPSLLPTFDSFHSSTTTGIPMDVCFSASTDSVSEVSDLQRSIISSANRARKKPRTS